MSKKKTIDYLSDEMQDYFDEPESLDEAQKKISDNEIKRLVKGLVKNIVEDEEWDMTYAYLQNIIGQTDGGVAGMFHSGMDSKVETFLVKCFKEYLKLEKSYEE